MAVRTGPSADSIYGRLSDGIISGEYAPESRLKEEVLAAEFGVSRTPVREALRQLENDGLVRIRPACGAAVIPFTAVDVEEVYDIRKALEMLATDCAIAALNLDRLALLRRKVQQVATSRDVREHAEMDATLHGYVAQASGRRRLLELLNQQLRLIRRFRILGFRDPKVIERATEEHNDYLDALIQRDAEKAKATLARHIDASKLCALAQLCSCA